MLFIWIVVLTYSLRWNSSLLFHPGGKKSMYLCHCLGNFVWHWLWDAYSFSFPKHSDPRLIASHTSSQLMIFVTLHHDLKNILNNNFKKDFLEAKRCARYLFTLEDCISHLQFSSSWPNPKTLWHLKTLKMRTVEISTTSKSFIPEIHI